MKYSGVDLHSNNNVVVVSDEVDRVVCAKRLPNELGKVLELLEPYRGQRARAIRLIEAMPGAPRLGPRVKLRDIARA